MADNIVLASFLLFAERGHIGRGQFRRRQGDGSRVDRLAVDACFIVQVRTGRTAGCTAKPITSPARDSAVGRAERAHVAVQGFHTVGMSNHHGIAVTAFPTFENHFAVGSALIGVPVGAA